MRIGSALDLGDLHDGFIANTLIGIVVVHRVTGPVHQFEHLAIGTIRVMGNRQTLNALPAQRIHPVP